MNEMSEEKGSEGLTAARAPESATERMWREHAEALEKAVERQDAVIGLVVIYVDDLIERAHAVNTSPVIEAGPFALYTESRLRDLVQRVAAEATK